MWLQNIHLAINRFPALPIKLKVTIFFSIVAVGIIFSSIIPPFQSPDESDHIKLAYLFSRGKILLDTPPNSSSGGFVDDGLLEYMKSYTFLFFHPENTLTRVDIAAFRKIKWTKTASFSPVAGYYFPLIYTPHALGLLIGENLNLTVNQSYRLARLFVFIFSALIIVFALSLFPANYFVVSLLILPMSIFQFVSASLDGITIALSILCISLFMRGINYRHEYPPWMPYVLATSIIILTTSRINLFPFIVFPLFIYFVRRTKIHLWIFIAVSILSIGWSVIALETTFDFRIERSFTTNQIIVHYVTHPLDFMKVLISTCSDVQLIEFCRNSFIGILGWLDTKFFVWFYTLSHIFLILMIILSTSFRNIKSDWCSRSTLLSVSIISTLLVFFALLVTWTPHPASSVGGLQGRYFTIPSILFAYTLSGDNNLFVFKRSIVSLFLLLIYGFLVLFFMPQVLIARYYSTPERIPSTQFTLQASSQLQSGVPIKLYMTADHINESIGLKSIKVRFRTDVRQNTGEAELILYGKNGQSIFRRFSLADILDNQYYNFELDSKQYISGEIVSTTGVGVSTWEAHDDKGHLYTCVIYLYSNGKESVTSGCPTQ